MTKAISPARIVIHFRGGARQEPVAGDSRRDLRDPAGGVVGDQHVAVPFLAEHPDRHRDDDPIANTSSVRLSSLAYTSARQ